jgi:hypothetical protein
MVTEVIQLNMAHFAKLDDNNIVLDIVVINNNVIEDLQFPESEPIGIQFLTEWSGGYTNWKQTSYNASFRKNYAGVGFTYNFNLDAFISPQPYPSWSLDTETCDWVAPIPYPTDGKRYNWDESTLNWIEFPTT